VPVVMKRAPILAIAAIFVISRNPRNRAGSPAPRSRPRYSGSLRYRSSQYQNEEENPSGVSLGGYPD